MAVYVDDLNARANVADGNKAVPGKWSQLFADTEEELRAFAAKIGLKQSWIRHPGQPDVHFDVVGRMRQRAIAAGAKPVTWHHAGEFLARRAPQVPTPAGQPVTSLLLVSGPRHGVTNETVRAALQLKFAKNIMLVVGGAAGVDTYAAQLWREWGGPVEAHPVPAGEWNRNPRGAGFARNRRMVQRVKDSGGSVLVIDLPCTKTGCPRPQPHNTHGTSHCAAIAEQAGLPVDHYQATSPPASNRSAHAERDHNRAKKLIADAQQVDPRPHMLWHRHPPGTQASQPARQPATAEQAAGRRDNQRQHRRQPARDRSPLPEPDAPGGTRAEPQLPAAVTRAHQPTAPATNAGPAQQRAQHSRGPAGDSTKRPECREDLPQARERDAEQMRQLATALDRQAGHAFRTGDTDRAYRLVSRAERQRAAGDRFRAARPGLAADRDLDREA